MSKLVLFYSSVSSNREIKKQQKRIQDVLESCKYEFELVDIAIEDGAKARMREICANEKALAPQLANADQYCGDYNDFDEAVESGTLKEFLKI